MADLLEAVHAQKSVLAERHTMGADRTPSAHRRARRRAGRRPARDQRYHSRAEDGLPLVRLPARIRALHNDLQSLCPLGQTRNLGEFVPQARRRRARRAHADDRLDPRQGAPLRKRGKRGEQNQAVGRSRGGRNTKIHALGDAKGRLIALLLTGGEAHDCPLAERLLKRSGPAKRLLGDKAYDSADLRDALERRGATPVIPNRCNRNEPFAFNRRTYKLRWRIEAAFNRLKDFRRIATRYDKLARNYLAGVCLVAALVWWI